MGVNPPAVLGGHILAPGGAAHGGRIPVAGLGALAPAFALVQNLPVRAVLKRAVALAVVVVEPLVPRARYEGGAHALAGDFVHFQRVGAGLGAAGAGGGGVVPEAMVLRTAHFGLAQRGTPVVLTGMELGGGGGVGEEEVVVVVVVVMVVAVVVMVVAVVVVVVVEEEEV